MDYDKRKSDKMRDQDKQIGLCRASALISFIKY